MKRRIISIILVLCLLMSVFPAGLVSAAETGEAHTGKIPAADVKVKTAETAAPVKAAENEKQSQLAPYAITGTGETVTRVQWLSELITLFEMTVDDETWPDNYFSDLDPDSDYYYNMLIAVDFGLVDVEAGGELQPEAPVTREFAAHTLNFCLGFQLEEKNYTFSEAASVAYPDDIQISINRGWFVLDSGNFLPQKNITAAEATAMLADAAEVLDAAEIDQNYNSVYTYAVDVIEVPEGTTVSTDADNVVRIIDCPVAIDAGDTYVVYFGGIPCAYLANAVTKNGNITTITSTPIEDGSAITDIDAQGAVDAEFTQFVPMEGTEVIFVNEITGEEFTDPVAAEKSIARSTQAATKSAINFKRSITAKSTLNLGSGISTTISFTLKDPKLNYSFNMKSMSAYVTLEGKYEVSFQVKGDLTDTVATKELQLALIGVKGIGGLEFSMVYDLSGTATGSFSGQMTVGTEYTKGSGFRLIRNFTANGFSLELEATLKAGFQISLGINDVPADILSGYVYGEIGAKGSLKRTSYSDNASPNVCLHTAMYLYLECGASFSFKVGSYKQSFSDKVKVWHDSNSPIRVVHHYEDGMEVAKCTRGTDTFSYYTPAGSNYWGSGWSGANGGYGLGANGEPIQIYSYIVDDNNNATITGYSGKAAVLSIPSNLDGHNIIAIGEGAFKNNSAIQRVNLPDTVARIEEKAFYKCTNLASIVLPDSLLSIGEEAFAYCSSLYELSLPKNLSSIEKAAFAYCTILYYVYIPISVSTGSVTYTYNEVFENASGIFNGCDNLSEISFEEGTTGIHGGLFAGSGIKEITIPKTVTFIGKYAFAFCKSLENVNFPVHLTEIGERAFWYCESLKCIEFPNKLSTIGKEAFSNCKALIEAYIPISVSEGSVTYTYNEVFENASGIFSGCNNLSEITFEKGTTLIHGGLFAGSGIKEITIPETVTLIGAYAFAFCKNLETVNFPVHLTEIREYAFWHCESLKSIEFPNKLSTIGEEAFSNCKALTDVYIPISVSTGSVTYTYNQISNTDYAYGIFNGCSNLNNVVFEEGTPIIHGGLFAGSGIKEITIPETVTLIGAYAFAFCKNLENVHFPENLTEIRKNAFWHCSSLKEVIIPDTVTEVGYSAFEGASNLRYAKMSNSVTCISFEMFSECTSLSNIELGNRIDTIDDYAFYKCTSLQEIHLSANLTTIGDYAFFNCTALKEIDIPDGVGTLGISAFSGCATLTEINVPDSVIKIGNSIFARCDNLSKATLGNGITEVPDQAFFECPSLQRIDIPYRVTEIGNKAFANCTGLKEITVPRSVETIYEDTFSYPDILTVFGVVGTYAEKVAVAIGATFIPIDIPATSIVLNEANLQMIKNDSFQLICSIMPANFTDAVTWKSSDTDVVTVTDAGVVKATGIGTATIKVVVGDVSASCKVTVLQPVTSISLNKTSLNLDALDTYALTASVSPSNANDPTILWSSSDEAIATVSDTGLVTAHKKGTATITASAKDGSGVTRTCKVTVLNNGIAATTLDQLQSPHNYPDNCSDFWTYTLAGASSLKVTFSPQTEIEDGFDYLLIFDAEGNQVGKYTGRELAGKTVTVPGSTVRIQLDTDDAGSAWGFRVTGITAENTSGGDDHQHSYTATVTRPTCTDDGFTTHTCSCGDTYIDSYTNALGHSWNGGIITTQPTDTTSGIRTYTCTRCGETKTETIPPKDHVHDYTAVTTAPTCTEAGYTTHTCSCGHSYTDANTPALGHSYTDGVCVRCGKEESGDKEDPLEKFTDVPEKTNWAYNGIAYCVEQGLMNGTSTTTFNPNGTVSRAQLVTILYRVAGSPTVTTSGTFTDVPAGQWYSNAIEWAAANGVVNGIGNGKFGPDQSITREQIATILYRYENQPAVSGDLNSFPDQGSVSGFAVTGLIWATQEGLITGVSSNGVTTLAPKNNATRAQIASIIMRYLES